MTNKDMEAAKSLTLRQQSHRSKVVYRSVTSHSKPRKSASMFAITYKQSLQSCNDHENSRDGHDSQETLAILLSRGNAAVNTYHAACDEIVL